MYMFVWAASITIRGPSEPNHNSNKNSNSSGNGKNINMCVCIYIYMYTCVYIYMYYHYDADDDDDDYYYYYVTYADYYHHSCLAVQSPEVVDEPEELLGTRIQKQTKRP